MTTSMLVTLIFLLADGAPAKDATVICSGVEVFAAGDDAQVQVDEGTPLIVDSRGAIQLIAKQPRTVTCNATFNSQRYSGQITLSRHGQVTKLYLKES